MPKKNVDLMLQVREQISREPETHSQGVWASRNDCGTTACVAGWAVILSGTPMDWRAIPTTTLVHDEEWVAWLVTHPADDQEPALCWTAGEGDHIRSVAEELLGLTPQEADALFYTARNGAALRLLDRYIEEGKNGE